MVSDYQAWLIDAVVNALGGKKGTMAEEYKEVWIDGLRFEQYPPEPKKRVPRFDPHEGRTPEEQAAYKALGPRCQCCGRPYTECNCVELWSPKKGNK